MNRRERMKRRRRIARRIKKKLWPYYRISQCIRRGYGVDAELSETSASDVDSESEREFPVEITAEIIEHVVRCPKDVVLLEHIKCLKKE